MKIEKLEGTKLTIESYRDLYPLLEYFKLELSNKSNFRCKKTNSTMDLVDDLLVICENSPLFTDKFKNEIVDITKTNIYKNLYNASEDFKEVYCKKSKRLYWLLGNMKSGEINFRDFEMYSVYMSTLYNINLQDICIDTIDFNPRFKYFKYLFYKNNYDIILNDNIIVVDDFGRYISNE